MALTQVDIVARKIRRNTHRKWPGTGADVLAGQLVDRLPAALRELVRNTPDGWKAQTMGPGRRHGISDPTLAFVIRREAGTDQYRQLADAITRAHAHSASPDRVATVLSIRRVLGIIDSWSPSLDPLLKKSLMCATVHPDDSGIESWVDPLCERVADVGRAGLCEACYRRRLRNMQQ